MSRELNMSRESSENFQIKLKSLEEDSAKFKECQMQLEIEKELRSRFEMR